MHHGPSNLGAVRHAALMERCRQVLGAQFLPVYEYLKAARLSSVAEKEVMHNLESLVGRTRLNDCMCVDELIFIEQMSEG